jgi:hypothetical protein
MEAGSQPSKPKKRKKKHGHRLCKADKRDKARLHILHGKQASIAEAAAVSMQEPAQLEGEFNYLPGLFVSFHFISFLSFNHH